MLLRLSFRGTNKSGHLYALSKSCTFLFTLEFFTFFSPQERIEFVKEFLKVTVFFACLVLVLFVRFPLHSKYHC